jgi:alkylated DNA repair dioxygenase AlkB
MNRTKIQEGFYDYGLFTETEQKKILNIVLKQIKQQGYFVKSNIAYAHYGLMWAVNDKGYDAFPVFGKYLRKSTEKTGFGKNLYKIDLEKELINKPNIGKDWYDYYKTDQLGNELTKLPVELVDLLQSKLCIDMSVYDCAIINCYGNNTVLNRHIDNTEDISANKIPIISISLLNDCIFYYSLSNNKPNHTLSDNQSLQLKKGQLVIFGGDSRYMAHRIETTQGSLTELQTTTGTMLVNRININIRRAKLVTDVEYNNWIESNKKLREN